MTKYEQFKTERLAGLTPNAAALAVGISNGAGYKYERKLRNELTPEAYLKIQSVYSRRSASAWSGKTNTGFRQIQPFQPTASSNDKGYAAEFLVKYLLIRHGLRFLEPRAQTSALDIVVEGPSGTFYRCEIKATTRGIIGLTRIKNPRGQRPISQRYTAEDGIDFFICVDLVTEHVAVLPWSFAKNYASVCLNPSSDAWPFLSKFEQFV